MARAAASVILAGALLVGTSACGLFSVPATLRNYDPTDGVNVTLGDVAIRNMVAIAAADGKSLSLAVTLINSGTSYANVTFQYPSNGAQATSVKFVRPEAPLALGSGPGQEQFIITNSGVKTGANLPVYVQTGATPGQLVQVPVLDGSLVQYSTLMPKTPTPTATPKAP
jgi:hypothetical protein